MKIIGKISYQQDCEEIATQNGQEDYIRKSTLVQTI